MINTELHNIIHETYTQLIKRNENEKTKINQNINLLQTQKNNLLTDFNNKIRNEKIDKTQQDIIKLKFKTKLLEKYHDEYVLKFEYIKNFIKNNNDLVQLFDKYSNIFSLEEEISKDDLYKLDELSILMSLIINVLPSILKIRYLHDDKYTFIDNILKKLKIKFLSTFDEKVYGYNVLTKTFSNYKERNNYIKACSYKSIINASQDNNKNDNYNSSRQMIAKSVIKILSGLTHQARIGTILTQILSFMYIKKVEHNDAYHGILFRYFRDDLEIKYAYQTYSFQTIIRLLYDYDYMPFRVKDGYILNNDDNRKDWTISLPDLLATLVNGVYFEMTGVLDKDAAITYVYHILTCAANGYVDELLKYKSKFRIWTKKLISKAKKIALLSYNEDQINSIKYSSGDNEYFFENEIDSIDEEIARYPSYMSSFVNKYFKWIDQLTNSDLDGQIATLLIRHAIITTHTITCPAIYYKTSPAAGLDASYKTKLNTNMIAPTIKKTILINDSLTTADFHYDKYNKYNQEIGLRIQNITKEHTDEQIFTDLPALFVGFLTNKSGGVKYSEDLYSINLDLEKSNIIQSVSQTRILNFLLTSEQYYSTEGIRKLSQTKIASGIRQQIDRRQRVISIKSNIDQLGEIIYLACFNKMKHSEPWIALGKQIGNILDARLQLYASGDKYTLMSSSDVSGMDASTLPHLANFIKRKMLDGILMNKRQFKQAFGFRDEEVEVNYYDENGYIVRSTIEIVSGLQLLLSFLNYCSDTSQLTLKDGYFLEEMYPSKFTFPSGKYFTSGNHTVLLVQLLKLLQEDILKYGIVINATVLGDDIFFNIKYANNLDNVKILITKFTEMMASYNLEVDVDVSRFTGGFLQQHVLCGLYLPLPARSSIFNVEKNETDPRNPMESIKIFIETNHISLNRQYSQKNSIPFIYAMWQSVRTKRYFNKAEKIKKIPNYSGIMSYNFNDSLYIVLPITLISVAPLGFPPLLLKDVKSKMVPLSILTPQGDFIYNYWFQVFKDQDFITNLCDQGNFYDTTTKFFRYATDWKMRNEYGITLSEHLIEFRRLPKLSEMRKEEIGIGNLYSMRDNLLRFGNQAKILESDTAIDILYSHNIKVPHGLTPKGVYEKKIVDSFTSRLENSNEMEAIDKNYIEYINDFSLIPNKNFEKYNFNTVFIRIEGELSQEQLIQEYHSNIPINKIISTEEMLYKNLINNLLMPILPCSFNGSDLSYILLISDFVNPSFMNVTASMTQIYDEASFGFDVSSAVQFVLSVIEHDASLKDTAISVLALNTELSIKFSNLIDRILREGYTSQYQSVFQYNKYFISNGDGSLFTHKFKSNTSEFKMIRNNDNYYKLLCRDFVYAFGKQLAGRNIYIVNEFINLLILIKERLKRQR